ncbi:GL18901 [Drosophila persimilis]|uniref:GL18901 n=1 Tax=Drosophila persimilis TaxID=7234 RepID=B4G843_DROPE|nr:GL18901 [Drosophila persimilis]
MLFLIELPSSQSRFRAGAGAGDAPQPNFNNLLSKKWAPERSWKIEDGASSLSNSMEVDLGLDLELEFELESH